MFRNLLRSLARSAAARSTLLVFGLLLVALPFLGCGAEHSEEGAGWHCPMHPTYTSDKPGDHRPVESSHRGPQSRIAGAEQALVLQQLTQRRGGPAVVVAILAGVLTQNFWVRKPVGHHR